MKNTKEKRLYFLDNLKVFLTVLVITHHAGQAYGPTGGDWPIFNDTRAAILGPFFTINASFFMGLFFLISGYFVPASFERKGSRIFLKDRFILLGVPILLSIPLFILATGTAQVGHLWFLEHLLLYAVLYVMWQNIFSKQINYLLKKIAVSHILFFIVFLTLTTFIIRIFYPIDNWLTILGFFRMEMAHIPQYATLFIIGILSYRSKLFDTLPTKLGISSLLVGIVLSILYAFYFLHRNSLPVLFSDGGFTFQSLTWSLWETLMCLGLSFGLVTLFREKFNFQTNFMKILSQVAFIAFVIHVWIIVGLQMALADVALPPLIKFILVCIVGIPICFFVSVVIRGVISASIRMIKKNNYRPL